MDDLRHGTFLAPRTPGSVAAAADALRRLNARQAQAGVASLQADLRRLREKGLIDERGRTRRGRRGDAEHDEDSAVV